MLAFVLTIATHQQTQDPALWLSLLKRYAVTEQVSLFVDVDLETIPHPFVIESPVGTVGLDRLGVAIDRSWSLVDGAYIFKRRIESGDLRAETPIQHVNNFLKPLGVIDLNALRLGSLTFASLNPNQQSSLRFVIANANDGVGDSMLARYPSQIGMRLVFDSKISTISKSNDGNATFEIPNENSIVPIPKQLNIETVVEPLGSPSDGTLDFGSGEILTLSDIIQRAQLAFGTDFSFDKRLATSVYFICGKYTPRRFITTLTAVTETTTFSSQKSDDVVQSTFNAQTLKQLVFGPYRSDKIGFANLTIGDVLDGKTRTFLEAFGNRPPQRIQAFMYEHRLEPADSFELASTISLCFATPGTAKIYSSQGASQTSFVPYNLPHLIKITL